MYHKFSLDWITLCSHIVCVLESFLVDSFIDMYHRGQSQDKGINKHSLPILTLIDLPSQCLF